MSIHKLCLSIAAIPKTIIFNFRYLSLKDAVKFPLIVSHRVAIQKLGGKIEIHAPIRANMIRIGVHENSAFDRRERPVWNNTGTVVFEGNAYIGNGSCIENAGNLSFGDSFKMSGNTKIVCRCNIRFGQNVLVGSECLFMDSDAHKIYCADSNGNKIVQNREVPIIIGNNIWFCTKCIVLKGVHIADGCVIAANTFLTKNVNQEKCVIGGNPIRVIKENIEWCV